MAKYNAHGSNGGTAIPGNDDVAIIGMALRFPDDVTNPHALWDYLMQKRSALSEFPASRWNKTAHSGYGAPNVVNNRHLLLEPH